MPFQPYNQDHAIIEVGFHLTLTEVISQQFITLLRPLADEWRGELPKIDIQDGDGSVKPGGFTISSDGRIMPIVSDCRFEMSSFLADGSLDCRVLVQGNTISINFMSYSRWEKIWSRAKKYITEIGRVTQNNSPGVSNMTMQVIDLFISESRHKEFDIETLFRKGGDYVPNSIFGKGAFWHLYQGWFRDLRANVPNILPGKLLERVHIDAGEQTIFRAFESQGKSVFGVKMDSFLRYDLEAPLSLDSIIKNDGGLDLLYRSMHSANKSIMIEFLTTEMATRINLNG